MEFPGEGARSLPAAPAWLRYRSHPCRSEESYAVLNYATLDQVTVEKIESMDPPSPPPSKPGSGGTARGAAGGFLLRVVMEKDSEGRREEIVLSAETL